MTPVELRLIFAGGGAQLIELGPAGCSIPGGVERIEFADVSSDIDRRRAAALVTIEALGRDGLETPQELALRARSAMRLPSQEIRPARAGAASAAAVDGEVELVLVPVSGEDWPPRAYLIGPVAAVTLQRLLGDALDGLNQDCQQTERQVAMDRTEAVTTLIPIAERGVGEIKYDKVTVAPLIVTAVLNMHPDEQPLLETAIEALLRPPDRAAQTGKELFVDREGNL